MQGILTSAELWQLCASEIGPISSSGCSASASKAESERSAVQVALDAACACFAAGSLPATSGPGCDATERGAARCATPLLRALSLLT